MIKLKNCCSESEGEKVVDTQSHNFRSGAIASDDKCRKTIKMSVCHELKEMIFGFWKIK